ncbi:MAG: Sulfate/thiosulfate import ATP-binding protein CysA [Alphaproteobacteria bacterium MarineAlpha9_Bin4]|nr:molybdenum ABC transporter ATP-binding protein [Pelagibacterales bacterium]PPR26502.1 MAG: Sulfate/thiosulfate import ATP-binding protein CysA [Alphaproteobacteria bacterium MarineAlpha9_Bin4]
MNNIININSKLGTFNLRVNLKLIKGINCLFGPSGSGKTTIINCIAGLIKPEYAKIKINNIILNNTEDNYFCPIHKRNIGYVFQDSRLFPHLTVIKNLMYGEKLFKGEKKNFNRNDIINLLNLEGLLDRYPYNLSGGEKQRVAIGRALLSQPKLIIMDEPLASLDQEKKHELLNYILRVYENFNIPIIYVSHSSTETFLIGHKINFISNGKLVFQGKKVDAFQYFNKEYNENQTDNLLKGKVIKVEDKKNITKIRVDNFSFFVVTKNLKKGENVFIRIKSTDFIVCKFKPETISALNLLKLKLSDIKISSFLVTLYFGFNKSFLKVSITKASLENLKLQKNQYYFVLVKAININDVMSFSLT